MTSTRATIGIWLALAPALTVVALLVGVSLLYGVAQSLGALAISGESRVSLDAYRDLLTGATPATREFWPALGFSLWVSLASTSLASLGALLVAVALSSRRQPTGGATLLMLNLNLAFPHLVWAVGLSLLLAQSGLLARVVAAAGLIDGPAAFPVLVRDRYGLGIILHYVSKEIPFLVLIVLAVLRTQGAVYDLVAENLGAGRWERLRYVTLPLVLPALAAGSALVFAFVFGAYEVPALLGVRYPRTLAVLALEFFVNPDLNRRAEGMAISLLISLIILAAVGLVNVKRVT
jgi:putative spermidine/putrescine transport system permease protein